VVRGQVLLEFNVGHLQVQELDEPTQLFGRFLPDEDQLDLALAQV
jgi:hypothetical protein